MPADGTGELALLGVAKRYGAGPLARPVVEDCSFVVPGGAFTVMIGPSGAGKSTLVRLIAGFEPPSAGRILIDGRPVAGPGPDRLVVFQETALFPWMSVRDNVAFGPRARGEAARTHEGRVTSLLQRVGLGNFAARYPAQLSGGMQRRAELARALANEPLVMILDEPFRGLDALTRRMMIEYYAELAAQTRITNLFVSTDIEEALLLADRVLVMTAAPTRVRALIEVDLPRPRRPEGLALSERAGAIRHDILSMLRREVGGAEAAAGSC